MDRIQNNTPYSYYEVDVKKGKTIAVGFAIETYPNSKRPGKSRLRYHQPTVGMETNGNIHINGTCEVYWDDQRLTFGLILPINNIHTR